MAGYDEIERVPGLSRNFLGFQLWNYLLFTLPRKREKSVYAAFWVLSLFAQEQTAAPSSLFQEERGVVREIHTDAFNTSFTVSCFTRLTISMA